MILETARLILDELAVGRDEMFVFELLNEPGFLDNIGDREVTDLEAATGYIEKGPAASYAANGFGLWRVILKAAGEPVGMSGLVKRDGLDDPDIGYAFLERHWGRGYAQEAGVAVLEYARNILNIPKIVAVTSLDNAASAAVLEKIGLTFAGEIQLPAHDASSRYFTTEAASSLAARGAK